MSDMTGHAKPPARRDHLWVVFVIAACCLIEVWTSWVAIGAMSGFPRLFGKISTDWTLAVTTEAYWAYALFAWLGAAPGPKSRRFAMWSAAVVFAMSLTGQGAAHLVRPGQQPSGALVVFVSALPVIVLASIAILIHFRQADREDAQQAETEREEAGERAALRAELAAAAARLAEAETARSDAEQRTAQAEARTAQLERKLAAQKNAQTARKTRAGNRAVSPRKSRATSEPEDVDARTEALRVLSQEPDISGAKLGPRVGKSARWGQLHRDELAAMAAEFTGTGDDSEMVAEDRREDDS